MRINEIKREIFEIEKWEGKTKRENLKHKTYDFKQCETIRSFCESIYTGKINKSR